MFRLFRPLHKGNRCAEAGSRRLGKTFAGFTRRARHALALAQEEARRLDHAYLGTEHLLLGLLREGDGLAGRVLADLGVALPPTRAEVARRIGRGERPGCGEIAVTPHLKAVLGLAVDEARRLHHPYIGTEHLLLALVREGEGVGARVLRAQGISPVQVREAVLTALIAGHGTSR